MFDTHAHVNFNAYKDDADEVMARALEKGVVMINVGSQYSTSARAVKMAEKFNSYAAIGLHPIHLKQKGICLEVDKNENVEFISRAEEFDYGKYLELGKSSSRIVAIGETGLDFYHIEVGDDREEVIKLQKSVFTRQIDLANELDLPMIIHCRGDKQNVTNAYFQMLEILQKNMPNKRGVMHCYLGGPELVEKFIELGFYIGFNGLITFDKTGLVEQSLEGVPLDRIVSETDCPYLTPVPNRGKRNEPAFVEFVVKKIAEVKNFAFDIAVEKLDKNARKLFQLV